VIAFLLTYVAHAHAPESAGPPSSQHAHDPALGARESIAHAARFGFVEMLDHTAPWLIAGLVAAALAEPTLPHDAFVGISPFVAVPIAAFLGVPFYVSASAAMPLLAVLMHKGLSPGSAVAFLLTGPAVTPKTISFLAKRFGPLAARMFAGGAVVVAVGCGLGLDALAGNAASLSLLSLHGAAPLVDRIALPFLALLVTASLLRQGPRAMLGKLLAGG
ncbi:MAG: permease, partial [Polyangiaceae bacterium]